MSKIRQGNEYHRCQYCARMLVTNKFELKKHERKCKSTGMPLSTRHRTKPRWLREWKPKKTRH